MRYLLPVLFFALVGCNATKNKLVWVRGAVNPNTGARVEIEGGGFTSGASARIENVAEYASVPKDWKGPVPWGRAPSEPEKGPPLDGADAPERTPDPEEPDVSPGD